MEEMIKAYIREYYIIDYLSTLIFPKSKTVSI